MFGMARRQQHAAGICWCAGKSTAANSSSVSPMSNPKARYADWPACRPTAISSNGPSRMPRVPAAGRLSGPGLTSLASSHGAGHDRPDVPRQKEHLRHREITASMLSCHDLIDILRHRLPSKVRTDDDMAAMIEECHRRRLKAMQSACQKQAETLGASK